MEATPRPWAFDAKSEEIWSPGKGLVATVKQRGPLVKVASDYRLLETEANGEFIVKAANAHDRLVEALEMARVIVAEVLEVEGGGNGSVPTTTQMALAAIDAALGAARGEGE